MPTRADRTGATLLRKADWHYLAAFPTEGVSPPASPDVTWQFLAIADRDLLLPKSVGVTVSPKKGASG